MKTPQDYRDDTIKDFRARLAAAKTYDFELEREMEEELDYARKDVKDAYNHVRRDKRSLASYEMHGWDRLIEMQRGFLATSEADLAGARAHRDEIRDGLKAWKRYQDWSAKETERIFEELRAEGYGR